jgi:hypothetical protein
VEKKWMKKINKIFEKKLKNIIANILVTILALKSWKNLW